MNKFQTILLTGFMTLGAVACSDDNDEPKLPDAENPTTAIGAFILNQGTYGLMIEGTLTATDYTTHSATQDVFLKANGRSLGATPQAGIAYGDKIYLGIYESNTIEILDRESFVSLKQISLSSATGQSPRSIVAKDGKVYISMYNGYVSRLDTLSLNIDGNVKVGPNPEIMAIKDNHLYVPNSDGLNWPNYGTTASRIDLKTFTVDETLEVGLNPTQFVSNGTDLFLLCKGNYGDVPSTIYKINDDGNMESIGIGNLMDIRGDKLYYINAPWDATEFDYTVYNTKTGESTKMLSDKGVDSPAAIGVDPVNGNIVITSYNIVGGYASYTTDGYVKVYDAAGSLLYQCDTGVGPCLVFFNHK